MNNPWLRKNPFMSMWLSGAHSTIGCARGPMTAAITQEANRAASAVTRACIAEAVEFWAKALKPPPARPERSSRTTRPKVRTAATRKARPAH